MSIGVVEHKVEKTRGPKGSAESTWVETTERDHLPRLQIGRHLNSLQLTGDNLYIIPQVRLLKLSNLQRRRGFAHMLRFMLHQVENTKRGDP
jgi:hypothetical protein